MELYQVGICTVTVFAFGFRGLMFLFLPLKDNQYQDILNIPSTGLTLKTKIYVSVSATNLTDRCVRTGVTNLALHAPLPSRLSVPLGHGPGRTDLESTVL